MATLVADRYLEEMSEMAGEEAVPRSAALIKDFVNTYDLEGAVDSLDTNAAMTRWFRDRDLLSTRTDIDDEAAASIRAVRDALRDVLLGHNGEPVPRQAVDVLNDAAENSRLCVKFTPEGSVLACSSTGADAALSGLIAAVHMAMAEGSWGRLKACRRDDCRWIFFDHSRNQSKTWCSMGVCGNRTKAEAYRQRHSHA
jgi:predicted RNA-binding Zn ribbon-like protein